MQCHGFTNLQDVLGHIRSERLQIGGTDMAIHRWLTTCVGLIVLLLGIGHAAIARAAAEILQVRAAAHQDDGPGNETLPRIRIVLDVAAPRPGTASAVEIKPIPIDSGSAWAVRLNMPLSGRAEAQIRSLPRRIPGVVFDLAGDGAAGASVLTLRFEKPTALARHFVLPGRGGQQERVVLDFVPDTAPAPVVATHVAAEVRVAQAGQVAEQAAKQTAEQARAGSQAGAGAGAAAQRQALLSSPAMDFSGPSNSAQADTAQVALAQSLPSEAGAARPQETQPAPGGTPGQPQGQEQGEPGTVQGTEPGVFDVGPSAPQTGDENLPGTPEGQGAPQAGTQKQPAAPGGGEDLQAQERRVNLPRPQAEPAGALPMRNEDELPPPPTGSSPLTLWGFFEAEGRWFPQDSRDGAPDHLIGSMAMEPTIEYAWKGGSQFLRFTGFARVDTVVENRTHADVREAKYVGVFGPLELTAGLDRRFWGVTEAVHLVNIINQVDTLEDVDFEDYLGQPLISAAYTTRFGTFSGFYMPYFRERLFPTGEDRPNLPVHVNRELTQYESGDNNWHSDWALRWAMDAGPVDLGVSYFSGFSREPRLLLSFNSFGQPQLIPRYDLIDQVGVDLQATLGALLLKFEGIHRWDPVNDYAAFAGGFEYTLYGVSAAGADLGILAEYLYDERGKGTPLAPGIPPFSNVSPYDDDLFVGLRWSGNDIATTEILGGAILDLDTKSKAFVLEASRRLGANLRISLDGRFFTSVSTRDVLYPLGDDDFLQLKLQWHY